MKLIIDIPEVMYEDIKSGKDGYSNYVHTAIRNGTPLDDVKAEFINRYPTNWAGEPELGGASCEFSLCRVLEILDNIGKAESGDKE